MKSEYDKMFYQHQSMMTSLPAEARPNLLQPFPTTGTEKTLNSCNTCRANNEKSNNVDLKPKSSCDDRSVCTKSSDMGMKEVLEQIQKFCIQLQENEKLGMGSGKKHKLPRLSMRNHDLRCSAVDEEDDDDEDDDLNMSSDADEMSLMSDDEKRKDELNDSVAN